MHLKKTIFLKIMKMKKCENSNIIAPCEYIYLRIICGEIPFSIEFQTPMVIFSLYRSEKI